MVQRLCTSGNHELLKCSVHGAAGVIAGLMAAYNIAACCFRRDRHLRINALIYTLAVGYEIKQTLHHLRNINPTAVPAPAVVRERLVDVVTREPAVEDQEEEVA